MGSALTDARHPTWPAAARAHFMDSGSVLRCTAIALVVGSILTIVNLGPALAGGRMGVAIAFAIAINYATPFIVSSLGGIATRRAGAMSNPRG